MGVIAKKEPRLGTRELRVVLDADTDFKSIVAYLEKTLVVPKLPGIRGCDPCLSGLDKLVIESPVFDAIG